MTKFRSTSSAIVKAQVLYNGISIKSSSSSATASATGSVKSDTNLDSISIATNLAQRLAYKALSTDVNSSETVLYITEGTSTVTNQIINWITNSSTLQASDGENTYNIKLVGFSLTHTENYAGYQIYVEYLPSPPSTQTNSQCLVYFNMNFCFQKYYNNTSGAITE